MDFIEALRQFSVQAAKLKEKIQNEEQTKTALVMPFFSASAGVQYI
jgi:hypothetical protein